MIAMCGSLSVIGSHNLIGSGTIKGCGFVGAGTALLEEVCYCRVGFEVFYAQDTAQCLSRLLVACKI